MEWPFQPHRLYNRRRDIHAVFGGQQQGGIATPARAPGIFLFTGHGAARVGYGDEWQPDGSLRYTGEGQVGDMRMIRGNQAIRDHVADGRDLLLFEKGGSGAPVRFVGFFVCAGWELERQQDTTGALRDAIVFTLVPAEVAAAGEHDIDGLDEPAGDLNKLRERAYAAATGEQRPKEAARSVFRRARAVRDYVLARANGQCEACKAPAPFMTSAGMPYLEPHHIRRLSDGGPDDPRHVGAVCPNCHRRAHFGHDGSQLNAELARYVAHLESG